LRRRRSVSSEQLDAAAEEGTGVEEEERREASLRAELEARAAKSKPQMFTSRLRAAGHQGRVAEAFSAEQREKIAAAASARR